MILTRLYRLIKSYFLKDDVLIPQISNSKSNEELYLEGIYESLCNEPDVWKLSNTGMRLVSRKIRILPFDTGRVDISGQRYYHKKILKKVELMIKNLIMMESLT